VVKIPSFLITAFGHLVMADCIDAEDVVLVVEAEENFSGYDVEHLLVLMNC
jgi:hypothetical protein